MCLKFCLLPAIWLHLSWFKGILVDFVVGRILWEFHAEVTSFYLLSVHFAQLLCSFAFCIKFLVTLWLVFQISNRKATCKAIISEVLAFDFLSTILLSSPRHMHIIYLFSSLFHLLCCLIVDIFCVFRINLGIFGSDSIHVIFLNA